MAKIDRRLGELILKLFAALPDARRDAKLTMAVYAEALADVSIAALEVAVLRATRECRFFPSPAELIEFATAHQLTLELEARRGEKRDTAHQALWRLRLAGYMRDIRAQRRRPFWPETWGPLPTDHECQAPDEILAAFGLRRPAVPERLTPEQVAAVLGVARRALAEMPGVARRPEAEKPPAESAGQRAVREAAAAAGAEWHRQQSSGA